ncbi:MAG: NUDIX hydrolase [Ferrimicrobium sp.]|jgi:8-oxo-dGTP pyrophosphatase MutT (NUDIX family)|uniref:NUDIX hydrolase n=1 Tax=Ferrimicrobium sp. TaxID=2926050 RepID=UPI00262AC667|nr:CoA pyrophosphatase [Ferrimicrobium sp.]MCL5973521.1 CoA pyrophosphatase [Actinomycetota bacterium]
MELHDLTQYLQRLPAVERRVPVTFDRERFKIGSHTEVIATLMARLSPVTAELVGNPAVVLILVYPHDGTSTVLMTRRAATLRHHPREVSFPGGAAEPGETLAQTALRETYEEVGIEPADVELIGLLGSGAVRVSGRSFSCVVGHAPTRPSIRTSIDEVEEVVELPLSIVGSSDYFSELWYSNSMGWGLFHFFVRRPDLIWGASARLLVDLLAILE